MNIYFGKVSKGNNPEQYEKGTNWLIEKLKMGNNK